MSWVSWVLAVALTAMFGAMLWSLVGSAGAGCLGAGAASSAFVLGWLAGTYDESDRG